MLAEGEEKKPKAETSFRVLDMRKQRATQSAWIAIFPDLL
jgi:hypothetical protein